MYCKACGKQIDDDSAFCNKCGASQRAGVSVAAPQLRWEYREVSVPLGHKVEAGWHLDGAIGIKNQSIENEINRAIARKVQDLASEGWEPEGPYMIRDLSRAGQLSYRKKESLFGSNTYYLDSVRLRMRRYTT